jgi:YVTN family beta-propeller protein
VPASPRRPSSRTFLIRRIVAGSVALVLLYLVFAVGSAAIGALGGSDDPGGEDVETAGETAASTVPPHLRVPEGPPAAERTLTLAQTISGEISPKSVVASNTGRVFAQNMMYNHTVTVYSSEGELVETISDQVDLADFGAAEQSTVVQGAPVEGALTPDASHYWVSNYSMYGPGQGPEGADECDPASSVSAGYTPSYLYRISMESLAVDDVVEVGLVPKYVATTPDGAYVLATNWCSWDLSIVSTETNEVVNTLDMGRYPRGIAVTPDSHYAYVAIMGESRLVKVDLTTQTVLESIEVGRGPRHIVMDPEGRFAYVSLNQLGDVVKVDLATDQVVATVHTGDEARSLAISNDGTALYVVNYESNTMTALRASDLGVLQTIDTGVHPIGITYDGMTGDVWVAIYTGQILRLSSA